MAQAMQFGEEELIAILNRRLAQAEGQRIAADVREARQEFGQGGSKAVTPDDLMREILQ